MTPGPPPRPDIVPWDGLSPSARVVVVRVIELLAEGFTGRIELECGQGGVRTIRESQTRRPGDLEDAA